MNITIKTLLAGLACALLVPSAVLADVYKYRDSRGHIHLTDKPMRGMTLLQRYQISTGRRIDGARSKSGGILAKMNKRRDDLAPLIDRAAMATRLRPALIHAVVRAESAYRSDAVSSKGAMGLMQLMPATAQRYGVSDRSDPAQNLRGGSEYLRDLLVMFENDLQLALAAYNAGENAVIRYGRRIPPYPETQNYVRKVIGFYNAMKGSGQLALR
jgi:soluble lytic murein transglycosylase-like protein